MSQIRLDDYENDVVAMAKEISFYLQKAGASPADSQDIAQDVLIKLLEAELVLPYDKIRAWLYRSAIRAYIDKYRRDKRYHELVQLDFFAPDQVTAFDRDDFDFLYQAVGRLKDLQALVIDAYYFQDLSVKAISQLLGMSQAKVKTTLFRARKALKRDLEGQGFDAQSLLND